MADFDQVRWDALVSGLICPICADRSAVGLVAELPSGRVVLQNDGDFVGYCILFYKDHKTELFQLTEEERTQLMADVNRVADAVSYYTRAPKLNYAILGNEVPHLHCHVVPRKPTDGYWGKPIWSRAAGDKKTLTPDKFERIRAAIAARINGEDDDD